MHSPNHEGLGEEHGRGDRTLSGWRSCGGGRGLDAPKATPPSRLHGAAGLRAGADGRIYVAQVPGSQMIPFSGIAIAADGAIYFSGDAEGSVQEIRTQ